MHTKLIDLDDIKTGDIIKVAIKEAHPSVINDFPPGSSVFINVDRVYIPITPDGTCTIHGRKSDTLDMLQKGIVINSQFVVSFNSEFYKVYEVELEEPEDIYDLLEELP